MRFAAHPLTLRQLQYAVAVGDEKSFRKAAVACGVSQPALSAQIAQLEAALGLTLFDRDQLRVVVTSAGAPFLDEARRIVAAADRLVDETRRTVDPLAGLLRLGVIPTVGPYLLPELARPLQQQFPRLRFVWVEDRTVGLVKRLRDGELDAAVVALESAELGEVQSLVLGRDPFLLATSNDHALATSVSPVSPRVLDRERVFVLEEGHCLGDQVAAVCQRARNAELDVRATSLPTLSQMVASGSGVTLLPALALPVENRRAQLHVRPFTEKAPGRTLALIWRKSTRTPRTLKAVAPVLRAAIAAATQATLRQM